MNRSFKDLLIWKASLGMDPSTCGLSNLRAPFGVNSSAYGLNNEPSF